MCSVFVFDSIFLHACSTSLVHSVGMLVTNLGSFFYFALQTSCLSLGVCFSGHVIRLTALLFPTIGSLLALAFLYSWFVHTLRFSTSMAQSIFLPVTHFASLACNVLQSIWLPLSPCCSSSVGRSLCLLFSFCDSFHVNAVHHKAAGDPVLPAPGRNAASPFWYLFPLLSTCVRIER